VPEVLPLMASNAAFKVVYDLLMAPALASVAQLIVTCAVIADILLRINIAIKVLILYIINSN